MTRYLLRWRDSCIIIRHLRKFACWAFNEGCYVTKFFFDITVFTSVGTARVLFVRLETGRRFMVGRILAGGGLASSVVIYKSVTRKMLTARRFTGRNDDRNFSSDYIKGSC